MILLLIVQAERDMGIRMTCWAFSNKLLNPTPQIPRPLPTANLVSIRRDIKICVLVSASSDSGVYGPHSLRNTILGNRQKKKIQSRIAGFINNPYLCYPDMDK